MTSGILDPIEKIIDKKPINTHGLICDFGKHKDTPWTRVPVSYLIWMVGQVGMSKERKDIAQAELDRRGTTIPEIQISGHAIDSASLRILGFWKKRKNKKQGFSSWLQERAKEAMKQGKEVEPGKYICDGICWVFEVGSEYPALKSVYKKK